MKDYNKRLAKLKERRQDVLTKAFSVSESFKRNQYGEAITYTLEAMEPIDSTYTSNTFQVCEKIQGHLKRGLAEYNIGVDFRYQGSVPTNTHIKLYSDVDLLNHTRWFFLIGATSNTYFSISRKSIGGLKGNEEKNL